MVMQMDIRSRREGSHFCRSLVYWDSTHEVWDWKKTTYTYILRTYSTTLEYIFCPDSKIIPYDIYHPETCYYWFWSYSFLIWYTNKIIALIWHDSINPHFIYNSILQCSAFSRLLIPVNSNPMLIDKQQLLINSYYHFYIFLKILKHNISWYKKELFSKVSFFWNQSQDISSSIVSRQKSRHLIGWPIWSTNYKPFLVGNHLNSCPDSNLRKNWL